jgi:leucyl/phenylalanyl-tRNA--protein transferase
MEACGDRPEGTWITPEIIHAYCELQRLGLAHSVESWKEERLVGGLYGVSLGGAFFGESMFHRARDASKVALVALVERMKERGFRLLDLQYMTEHLRRFGAVEISRGEYLRRLAEAVRLRRSFTDP